MFQNFSLENMLTSQAALPFKAASWREHGTLDFFLNPKY